MQFPLDDYKSTHSFTDQRFKNGDFSMLYSISSDISSVYFHSNSNPRHANHAPLSAHPQPHAAPARTPASVRADAEKCRSQPAGSPRSPQAAVSVVALSPNSPRSKPNSGLTRDVLHPDIRAVRHLAADFRPHSQPHRPLLPHPLFPVALKNV